MTLARSLTPSVALSIATVSKPPQLAPALRAFDSRALFGDTREVMIEHGGERYRLRWTRNGKLILTK